MNILTTDLLKNKVVIAILTILTLIMCIAWVLKYTSLESRCRRHYEQLGTMSGANRSKLAEMQFKAASEPLIQTCIENGDPN